MFVLVGIDVRPDDLEPFSASPARGHTGIDRDDIDGRTGIEQDAGLGRSLATTSRRLRICSGCVFGCRAPKEGCRTSSFLHPARSRLQQTAGRGLQAHLHRMFPVVVDQVDTPIVLLHTIDRGPHLPLTCLAR